MRILAFSGETPNEKSGGGLGILQSVVSLSGVAETDYIYPVGSSDPTGKQYDNLVQTVYHLTISTSLKTRLIQAIKGITTCYYDSYCAIRNSIDWKKYDLVYVDSSRYDFIAKEAKRNGLICVIRMHNIEGDYTLSVFREDKSLFNFTRYMLTKMHERKTISVGDYFFCLTMKDKERLLELYGKYLKPSQVFVVPVCLSEASHTTLKPSETEERYILITGTLWFGPNESGVRWFIENVWNAYEFQSTRLYIAGAKPTQELLNLAEKSRNTKVVINPSIAEMDTLFDNAWVYVAPVFKGAGMKVRIADAMRHRKLIIGSSHALIGYEKAINVLYCANTPLEFAEQIKNLSKLSKQEREVKQEAVLSAFEEHYSYNSSADEFKRIINEIQVKR